MGFARGCGGLPLKSSRVYSAMDTSDVHAAVCHIERLYPNAPIMLAGYSLGAMLLTKYIAELPSEPRHTGKRCIETYLLLMQLPLCYRAMRGDCRKAAYKEGIKDPVQCSNFYSNVWTCLSTWPWRNSV